MNDDLSTIQTFGLYNNKQNRITSKEQEDNKKYMEFMKDINIPVFFCE